MQKQVEALGQCPFCESSDVALGGAGPDSRWVRCIACNAEGPWAPNDTEAAFLWNRRGAPRSLAGQAEIMLEKAIAEEAK